MTLQKLRAESKETSALLPFFCRKEYRMWSLGPQVLTTLATGLASRKVDNPYVKDVYWPEILLALLQGETMKRREQTALSRAARRVYLVHAENGDWSKDFDALDTEAKAIHGRLVSSRHAFFGFRVMMGVDLASSYSLALCETAVRFAAEVEEQDGWERGEQVFERLFPTLPVDPITGMPFQLRKEDDGYRVLPVDVPIQKEIWNCPREGFLIQAKD